MKRAIIIGATSGIGYEIAKELLLQGWHIGIAGRRQQLLETFQATAPEKIVTQTMDVTQEDANEKLQNLIEKLGGMDLFLLSSGVGYQNPELKAEIELKTIHTNVEGFSRMTTAAFRYFEKQNRNKQSSNHNKETAGHIAVISSIAGTKGIGIAPAYSATKRFQNIYIDALEQLAYQQKLNIRFTDIRPGFVATDLLNDNKKYPLLMDAKKVGKQIVRALNQNKRVIIVDWRYAILVFFWQLIPRCIWKRLPIKINETSAK